MKSWTEKMVESMPKGNERETLIIFKDGLEHYSNKIVEIVNNTPTTDMHMMLFALRAITTALETAEPAAANIAKQAEKFMQHIFVDISAIKKAPPDKPGGART